MIVFLAGASGSKEQRRALRFAKEKGEFGVLVSFFSTSEKQVKRLSKILKRKENENLSE